MLMMEYNTRLLQEDRNFEDCVKLALADEAAVRESQHLSSALPSSTPEFFIDKKNKEKCMKRATLEG